MRIPVPITHRHLLLKLLSRGGLLGEELEVPPSQHEESNPPEGMVQKDPDPLPYGPGEAGDGFRGDLAAEFEPEESIIEKEAADDQGPLTLAGINPVQYPPEAMKAMDEGGPFLGEPE